MKAPPQPTFNPHTHDAPPDPKKGGKATPKRTEHHPNTCSVGGFRFGSSTAVHLRANEEVELERLAARHPRLNKNPNAGLDLSAHKLTAAANAVSHQTDHTPAHEKSPFGVASPEPMGPIKEAAPYHEVAAAVQPEPSAEQKLDALYKSWRRPSSSDIAPTAGRGAGGGAQPSRRYSSSSAGSSFEGRVTRRRGSEVVIKM